MRTILDKAVRAAQQLLTKAICECGHYDADHWRGACGACHCPKFSPVRFTVTRQA